MDAKIQEIAKIWPGIRDFFSVPHDQASYDRLVNILDDLIDEVGQDESHPLVSLMETLGSLIETYETQNVVEIDGNPIDVIKMLMKDHGLTQSDLPEIGSQGVVSEILSGKRHLNTRQIKRLCQRFHISSTIFV